MRDGTGHWTGIRWPHVEIEPVVEMLVMGSTVPWTRRSGLKISSGSTDSAAQRISGKGRVPRQKKGGGYRQGRDIRKSKASATPVSQRHLANIVDNSRGVWQSKR